MRKKKEDELYCVYCGTKNTKNNKKCSKCNKKLNPRNHLFRDYLKDHIKDDIDGNIQDGLLEIIENWIRTHLFGVGFATFVGIAAVAVIVNEVSLSNIKKQKDSYNTVNTSFTWKTFCSEKELFDKVKVCDAGYSLEGDTCVSRTSVDAIRNTVCPNGYSLSGGRCLSNFTVDKVENVTCSDDDIPVTLIRISYGNVYGTYKSGNECYAKYCDFPAGTVATYTESECPNVLSQKIDKRTSYYCAEYTDGNGNCHTYKNVSYTYSCSTGTLEGTKCITTTTKEYNEICPEGTTYDNECSKCVKS